MTLDPVPALGGSLLAAFPMNTKGECPCTPLPDPGLQTNSVIATTTAIAYPRNTPNKPDVCIVRLLISLYMPMDVNLDFVVNGTDIKLVESSTYYNFILTDPSTCPNNTDGFRDCGRVDVNGDGFVNQLDTTSIHQSANTTKGFNIPCGGVYATAFSCGSTRSAPLTPAVDISFDSIVYFDTDGIYGTAVSSRKRAALATDHGMLSGILVDFEHLHSEVVSLKGDVSVHEAKLVEQGAKLQRVEHMESQVDQHDRVLRKALPVDQREVLAGVSVAVAGVILCGVAVYFIAKRR